MLHKTYLVSSDYLNKSTKPPLAPSPEVKMPRKPPLPKKRNTNKRPVKKKKKKSQHPYDKWVKLRTKLREAEVERKRPTKTIADFLKQVLHTTTVLDRKLTPKIISLHSGT